ncbi:efflux RND transporter periplasmic adaptor subunit [Rickettsia canadensis]|uniref:RND family efflux transporter MFP subunit n=1 Tax=Rickettsia canadensis str. CA410 TaxID=1105107 RepID=A0ABM5MS33_RICCA|nr:efflux RND transporter periplasmic adaptor subunit [Rickettsia canadensis]AFB21248.1 RND family efflux transporter MFP subunit [Rickettsia canadensis str. CA410]
MFIKFINLLILLISLSAIANKALTTNITSVKATKVQIAELYDIFNVVGQCQNDNSHDYYANATGVVEKVSAHQGKIVKKGDILLVIDQNIAETTKSRAAALLNTKQEDYNRKEALFAKKFVSSEEYKRSKSELEDAKFNYSKALKTYNDMIITAPYSGQIGVIKAKVGDEIKIGDYLFSITGTENSQSIFIELPESLSGKVGVDTEVLIAGKIKSKIGAVSHYLSDNGTITAKIMLPYEDTDFLNNETTKKEFEGNTSHRTAAYKEVREDARTGLTYKLPLEASYSKSLLHNSFVDVMLIINPHKNLTVPESCIQRNNQGHFIYKIDGDTSKQLYVKIGTRTEGLIEIISNDIKEGDLVVTEGMTKISDGSKVKILEE